MGCPGAWAHSVKYLRAPFEDCNGKKDRCAVLGCNNDRLLPEKYIVKDHISNT